MTREDAIANAILQYVDTGQLAGAAALVSRQGRILQTVAVGRRDLATALPVERDTIFRIASMTKPVTTAAALMLLDEGRFELDEPITGCAPELARMRVLRIPDGPLDQADDAARPITFRDLLTHRSGLTYGEFHRGPIARVFADALGAQIDSPLTLCGFDDNGRLTTLASAPGRHAFVERPAGLTFESGGQGLWSTLDDYLAFARMLIGDATKEAQLLRPDTLAMMTSNQLTPEQRAAARLLGQSVFAEGHGYGMGVAVVMEPEKADPLRCRGGIGTIGWPGAYGGWWQADPNDRSVLIFLAHNMLELHQMARGIGLGVWSAIAGFHAMARS